jgi:excisionase family DNA binding protein
MGRHHRPPHGIELLTLSEAADALRLSRRTLQRLISSGALPTVRIGQRRLVRAVDLRWLVARSLDRRRH